MTAWSLFAVVVAALAVVPQEALGHGWMAVPASRHLCNIPKLGRFTMGGGLSKEGFCGWSEQDGEACEPQETYEEGSVVTLRYGIRANHGGFIRCRICDDPNNMSEACFDRNILRTADQDSDRWYIRENDSAEGEFWTSEWKLPSGLTGDHVVMSCSWYCAQHCSIPCDESLCGPVYSNSQNPYGTRGNFVYPECPAGWQERTTGPRGPQTFTNCADIRITGNGGGGDGARLPGADPVTEELQMEMAQEEEDETGLDVSNSGMADDLTCGDDKVAGVLLSINEARSAAGQERVMCSDRSTGAAANWAYLMAQEGAVSSDEASNCELSEFQAGCLEIAIQSGSQNPVDETSASDRAALLEGPHTHVGIGYFEEYWVILAGNMEGASVLSTDPAPEPAMDPVQETTVEATPQPPAEEEQEKEMDDGANAGGGSGGSVRNFLNHYFSQA